MICNNCNHENEEGAKFCTNCGANLQDTEEKEVIVAEEPSVDVIEEDSVQEEADWYYVSNNASTGPFTKSQMIEFVQNGTLKATTYVWKTGMEDWILLKNSELSSYLPQTTSQESYSYSANTNYGTNGGIAPIRERSIVLNILLTIVTCGIYEFVWLYLMAKDINELEVSQNEPMSMDPMMAVLLTIVACGLYQIYFFYKAGKSVSRLHSKYPVGDNSALLAILGCLAPIISMAILQDSINSIVRYGE
ncbi:DUF4234 domain-containing protein [Dubosiella newyorkensis]|uniref:DUF4234 domain-containing protein n=2 Tax=Dubosiella newyorkensis TaxID=1862672 RepID=UPI0025745F52|nr:DUF4234 domain-containing protein [Dubosiella newyorkensis]